MTDVAFDLPLHCRKAAEGSAWCALLVAVNTSPGELSDLVRIVGVPHISGEARQRAFDACLDAWTVYVDGRDQGGIEVLVEA